MLHILISLRARLLVVLAGSLLTGCSFHRTVVNDGVRYLDPSFSVRIGADGKVASVNRFRGSDQISYGLWPFGD